MVEIRRATRSDAKATAAVFTASRRDAGEAIPASIHTPDEDAWFVREVLIAQRETWVAVEGEHVVGLMVLDGDFVDQLYIASTAQRSRLGARFVELAKHARPDGLQLWVFQSNLAAQQFYARHGFVEVERTDGARNEERAPDIRMAWMSTR
jgi:ribosomal protein S18 acetylase RimI-like enzyme